MSYKKKLRAAERAERRSELLNKIEKFKGYTTSKAGDDFDKPRSPADQEIWHKIGEMEIEISQLDYLDYADMEVGKKILLWIQFVLQNVAYDASSLADTVIKKLQNLFENLGEVFAKKDKEEHLIDFLNSGRTVEDYWNSIGNKKRNKIEEIIAGVKYEFELMQKRMQNKKLPLYEGPSDDCLNECQNLSECLFKLSGLWDELSQSSSLPSFSSMGIEKVFALIPYSKKDMETKLPIRVMENIFDFVDFYFGNPKTLKHTLEYILITHAIVDEERINMAKKVMVAAFGCSYGLHITPKKLIQNASVKPALKSAGPFNLKDFASSLSAEELANNFENNLKNWKNRFEKGEDNYDKVDKRICIEEPSVCKKQIFSNLFWCIPDFFIHDYYAEARKELEGEDKKELKKDKRELKYYAKNDKRFKDAEYILANRKLREKFLGEEYDDNIEIGVANKNKELLEKLKSKSVEK